MSLNVTEIRQTFGDLGQTRSQVASLCDEVERLTAELQEATEILRRVRDEEVNDIVSDETWDALNAFMAKWEARS